MTSAEKARREAEVAAFWDAVARRLRRRPPPDPLLEGFRSAFDLSPRWRRTWLSESEGAWADWVGLGCDLRRAIRKAPPRS